MPRKAVSRLIWLLVIPFISAILAVWLLPATELHQYLPWSRPKISEQARLLFEEKTGVRITLVAVTSGGGMIDLRYQVIDPDKAVIVHDPANPLTVINEANGRELNVPWMNHVHNGQYQSGVTYYTLLMNPDGQIKPGSLVTVRIGGVSLEHWVVQ